MKVISAEKKLCLSCMEEHEVKRVEVQEENIFKGVTVNYPARYEYCDRTNELLTYEDSLNTNDLVFKDAYREKTGLLTSREIVGIREMYGVSQKDFCVILGWGSSTINRYENHQVQDGVHDDVLRKLADDPRWFLDLLERAKGALTDKAYRKYLGRVRERHHREQNQYVIKCLEAANAKHRGDGNLTGSTGLDLGKVVDVINLLAQKVHNLHLVKLIKMMWYSDNLHYKREGKAITGLVYVALPMGAVPEGYKNLLLLDGVQYEEIPYNENIGYKFEAPANFRAEQLSGSEVQAIAEVVKRFKNCNASEISARMHEEEAYKNTPSQKPISYEHAENLSI